MECQQRLQRNRPYFMSTNLFLGDAGKNPDNCKPKFLRKDVLEIMMNPNGNEITYNGREYQIVNAELYGCEQPAQGIQRGTAHVHGQIQAGGHPLPAMFPQPPMPYPYTHMVPLQQPTTGQPAGYQQMMYPFMYYPPPVQTPTNVAAQMVGSPTQPAQVSPLIGPATSESPKKRCPVDEDLVDEVIGEAADALKLTNAEHTAVKVTLFENYIRSYDSLTLAIQDGMLEKFLHPALAEALSKAVKDFEAALTIDEKTETPKSVRNPERFTFGAVHVHVASPLKAGSARILATLACDINPHLVSGSDVVAHVSKVTGLSMSCFCLAHEGKVIQRLLDPLTKSNIGAGCTLITFIVPSSLTGEFHVVLERRIGHVPVFRADEERTGLLMSTAYYDRAASTGSCRRRVARRGRSTIDA